MPLLTPGGYAPRQSTPTSCGAAALVMARALIDPAFADWLACQDLLPQNESQLPSALAHPANTVHETSKAAVDVEPEKERRWALAQSEVMARTNAVTRRPGIMQVPWPVSLGTPPWGARSELERSGSVPGVSYEIRPVRFMDETSLGATFDGTISRVGVGRPVLLYVGNVLLPRHVVLWARTEPGTPVVQYEPLHGRVDTPDRERFVNGKLMLAGWKLPWFLVRPDPVVMARESSRFGLRLPQVGPGIA